MNRTLPTLAVVLPCYNEEAMLPRSCSTLIATLNALVAEKRVASQSFLVFVDDGSRDDSWKLIEEAAKNNPQIRGIKLSFNAGHQSALMAGMMESREEVDCIISMDADLQHDVSVLPDMLQQFSDGSDIVVGLRRNRAGDGIVKRLFSDGYYRAMRLMGAPLQAQHADFRLLGRNVLDALSCYPERKLFLRGIIASMGFVQSVAPYTQQERSHGESKYGFLKMLSLAWSGILSFSALPLRLSAFLSLFTLLMAVLVAISTFVDYVSGNTVTGWSSIMLVMLFLGSIQLFCIAVLGEYIANIYIEVKRRPYYIVEKKAG